MILFTFRNGCSPGFDRYGDNHYICAAYKDGDIFEKYLDLHYEIKKSNGYEK